jgi:hypothetical protein
MASPVEAQVVGGVRPLSVDEFPRLPVFLRRGRPTREVERDAARVLPRIVNEVTFPVARAGYLLALADTLDPPPTRSDGSSDT